MLERRKFKKKFKDLVINISAEGDLVNSTRTQQLKTLITKENVEKYLHISFYENYNDNEHHDDQYSPLIMMIKYNVPRNLILQFLDIEKNIVYFDKNDERIVISPHVAQKTKASANALFYAINRMDVELVQSILDNIQNVNQDLLVDFLTSELSETVHELKPFRKGDTPLRAALRLAEERDNTTIVEAILNSFNDNLVVKNKLLHKEKSFANFIKFSTKNLKIYQCLDGFGQCDDVAHTNVDYDNVGVENGSKGIHVAAVYASVDVMKKIFTRIDTIHIVEEKADIDREESENYSNLNSKDGIGCTPLMYAVAHQRLDMVDYLLDLENNILKNIPNTNSNSAFSNIEKQLDQKDNEGNYVLMYAAKYIRDPVIIKKFLEMSKNLTVDNCKSCLKIALKAENLDFCITLLNHTKDSMLFLNNVDEFCTISQNGSLLFTLFGHLINLVQSKKNLPNNPSYDFSLTDSKKITEIGAILELIKKLGIGDELLTDLLKKSGSENAYASFSDNTYKDYLSEGVYDSTFGNIFNKDLFELHDEVLKLLKRRAEENAHAMLNEIEKQRTTTVPTVRKFSSLVEVATTDSLSFVFPTGPAKGKTIVSYLKNDENLKNTSNKKFKAVHEKSIVLTDQQVKILDEADNKYLSLKLAAIEGNFNEFKDILKASENPLELLTRKDCFGKTIFHVANPEIKPLIRLLGYLIDRVADKDDYYICSFFGCSRKDKISHAIALGEKVGLDHTMLIKLVTSVDAKLANLEPITYDNDTKNNKSYQQGDLGKIHKSLNRMIGT